MVKFRVETDILKLPARIYLVERDCAAFRALLAKTLKLGKMEFMETWESNGSTFVKLVTAPEMGNWVPKSLRRVKITTELSIVEEGPGACRQVLEGEVSVKVLGMGKMIEGIIEESIRKTYEVLAQVVERWCVIRAELMQQPDGASQLQSGTPFKFTAMDHSAMQHLEHDLRSSLQEPYSPTASAALAHPKRKRPPPLVLDVDDAHLDKTKSVETPLSTATDVFHDPMELFLSPGTSPGAHPLSPHKSAALSHDKATFKSVLHSPLDAIRAVGAREYSRMDSNESAELRMKFGAVTSFTSVSDSTEAESVEFYDAGELLLCPGCAGCATASCTGLNSQTTEALLADRRQAMREVGSSQEVELLLLHGGAARLKINADDSAHLLATREDHGHLQPTPSIVRTSTPSCDPPSSSPLPPEESAVFQPSPSIMMPSHSRATSMTASLTRPAHRRRSSLFCMLPPLTTDTAAYNQDFNDWTKVWSDMGVAEYQMANPSARLLHLLALLLSWGLVKIVEPKAKSTPKITAAKSTPISIPSPAGPAEKVQSVAKVRGRWMFRCFSCYVPEEHAHQIKEKAKSGKRGHKDKEKRLLGKKYTQLA